MCYFNLEPKDFNPQVLYTFKKIVSGGTAMKSHAHDFTSLIYVLEGTCKYIVEDTEYAIEEGHLIVLHPHSPHQRIIDASEQVTEFHVGFNHFYMDGLPEGYLLPPDAPPVIMFNSYKQTFANCCEEIMNEQNKHEPYKGLILKSLIMKLITLIIREHALSQLHHIDSHNIEKSDRSEIVQTIIDYMNENYSKNISLSKLSQNMYLSPVYISKIFKEELSESPINYLIQLRLSKASELLEQNKDLSVKEVSQAVGYDDAYYFSKLFKKYYHTSPSKYTRPPQD